MRRQYPEQQQAWMADILEGLDESVMEQIRAESLQITLPEGESVPEPRQCAIRVASGFLKLSVISNDRAFGLALFGPGDTLCVPLFHEWDTELYRVEAQEPSEVWIIPRKVLLGVAEAHREVGIAMLRQLSWGCWHLMETTRMLAFHNLPQRIAEVLVNLTAVFGVETYKGVALGLRITQDELAQFAGARRETLCAVLQDLQEEEVLEIRYAHVTIKNMDRLRALAGCKPRRFLNPRDMARVEAGDSGISKGQSAAP